ncbi:MAG: prepilin peptidase [Firmicutes bacterium]|nr:prepilin peptidase [Bacillota bacterium]
MVPTGLTLGSLLVMAVYTDVRYRRIPNALLVPFAIWGMALQAYAFGWPGAADAAGGLGLGLLLLLPAYLAGGIGGGDVKLLATIGAIGGLAFVWRTFLAGALVGGILAVIQLAVERRLRPVLKNLAFWLWTVVTPGARPAPLAKLDAERKWGRVPYAVPLSLGAIISWLW